MKRSAHGHGLLDVPAKPDPRAATPPVGSVRVDVRSLEHELRRSTEAEVRFSDGDRAIYSTGGSNYRQLPIGVVIPRSVDDVVETVRVCREHGAPLLPRGGGTSLAGQSCNVAVILDFSKYLNRILEIDADRKLARVQPGLILDHLREPAERDDQLPESGFDVAAALTGTEGTCATILEATVHLLDAPKHKSLLVVGWENEFAAADHVMQVMEHKPTGLEGVDHVLIEDMKVIGMHPEDIDLMPEGQGWLVVEFGGEDREEADAKAHDLIRELKKDSDPPRGIKLFDDVEQEQHVWNVREAGLGATAFIPGKPDTYEGWEDSAVPPERLGEYLRRLRKIADRYGYDSALYGHYGQGCVHARWNFDLRSVPGIQAFRSFLDEASDLVLELGGSFSGEHGDGESRAELLPKMFGPELVEAFREFKSIWDPDWKMNPGKVVDPYR